MAIILIHLLFIILIKSQVGLYISIVWYRITQELYLTIGCSEISVQILYLKRKLLFLISLFVICFCWAKQNILNYYVLLFDFPTNWIKEFSPIIHDFLQTWYMLESCSKHWRIFSLSISSALIASSKLPVTVITLST